MQLDLYVPRNPRANSYGITGGSGIVGFTDPSSGLVVLYYEGNIYDAVNLRTYNQRVHQAASRAVTRYPTVARITIPRTELEESFIWVGTYLYETHQLSLEDNAGYLDTWIATPVAR